jgi:hypothetical protein
MNFYMQNKWKFEVFINEKQVILTSIKLRFEIELYMKSSVKGRNYLIKYVFGIVVNCVF